MDIDYSSPTMLEGMRLSLADQVKQHIDQIEEQTKRFIIDTSISSSKYRWKTRWWSNAYIKLNFCIMFDIVSNPYVVCYKCNETFDVKFLSNLKEHLGSKRHACASNIWYTLGNTIPSNAYFPDPDSVDEVIRPDEALVEDQFLVDGNLRIAKNNEFKRV